MRMSIVLASFGLAFLAAANPGMLAAAPVIGTPSNLNYGNALVGVSVTQTLTIQNNGDALLTVTALSFSGPNAGQFSFQSPPTVPFNVSVGGSVSFTTVFSPTFRGPKTASLSISSNDPVTPTKVVSLSGTGVAPVIGTGPPSIAFGNVNVLATGNLNLNISNQGDVGQILTVNNLTFVGGDASQFTYTSPSLPFNISAGGSTNVTITFSPTSTGVKTTTLQIASNDPVTPTKSLSVSGTGVAPVITTAPPSLDFGSVHIATTADLPVLVSNSGNANLSISSLTLSGANAASFSLVAPPATPINLAPGASTSITLRYAPAALGPMTASFNLASNDPVTPTKSLSVSGTGVAPVITTAPPSLDFGSVHIATTADLSVLVSNSGTANLSISSLTLSGANAASFSLVSPPATPINLAPGASTPITVRFAPTALGPMTASFNLASNDPVTPTKTVALAGLSIRPEPVIAGARDVPNDQGGKLKLSWDASTYDTQASPVVDHYWVFRSVPPQLALARIGAGMGTNSPFGAADAKAGPGFIISPSTASIIYWELLATVPALHFIAGYSYIAATLSDSTAQSNPKTLFMVMALNADNTSHWDSAPDSGYSVDNLSHAQPASFTGSYAAGATHLHWFPNSESDLAGYRIYRGASADFVPGPANSIGAVPDTGFVDPGPAGSCYKLSAIDLHGNESQFALVAPGSPVGVPNGEPTPFAIAPPRPNPAIGSITLAFALPEARATTLEVYDVQGRRVRTLVHGLRPAGWQNVLWDGRDERGNMVSKGIFFVRLASAGQSSTAQFTFLQ